jgi:hypothetical protein
MKDIYVGLWLLPMACVLWLVSCGKIVLGCWPRVMHVVCVECRR